MRGMKRVLILIIILLNSVTLSLAKEIPFTQDDRDRLIRLEEGLKAVNQRIDSLDKRIDGLQGLMYVVIGAVIAQTIGIVGFVLWDRRTALAPAIRKNKELEEKEEKVEKALREYAKKEPRLAEILREVGLL